MVIRCERCSTMYELDESLLAPTGSEVQCTRCQHVFTAYPPGAPARPPAGAPAQPPAAASPEPAPPPSPATPSAPATPPAPRPQTTAPSGPSPAAARADGAAPRPVRTTAPPVYRPQASTVPGGSAPVTRAPVLKRDTVGTFEARLRWSARWRWLAPVIAVVVVALAVGSWALLRRRGDAGADQVRAEALALVALDDSANVEEAVSRLTAVVNKRPKLRAAAADRALALVIRAAGIAEEAEALSARAAAARDERERARREQSPGWQDAERAASTEAAALEPEVRAREEKTRTISSGARDQLAILQAEAGETLEVVRALALLHALAGERDRLHRDVRVAHEKGLRDPWIDLAEGWGDARDPDRAARERALVKLGAVAAARPDLVRGRYLLARAQASLGRAPEALATVDGVLSANPKHEGAKRLKEELAAPPREPPPPPAQAPAPAPVKPAPQARKSVSQAAPAASAPAPSGAPQQHPATDPGSVSPPSSPPAGALPSEPPPPAAPAPQEPPAAAPAPPAPPPAAPAPRRRAMPSTPQGSEGG